MPANKSLPPQDLINAINAHNAPSSYAVIAHPYGSLAWADWTVTGFRAMELFSQETTAKAETISRWFTLLRSGLASTLSGGGFVVGVVNSDCHNFQAPGLRDLLGCTRPRIHRQTGLLSGMQSGLVESALPTRKTLDTLPLTVLFREVS